MDGGNGVLNIAPVNLDHNRILIYRQLLAVEEKAGSSWHCRAGMF